jgi:hypothetical protein
MASARASSERSGSIQSEDRPKTSFQTKADPNMALYEAQPSKLTIPILLAQLEKSNLKLIPQQCP